VLFDAEQRLKLFLWIERVNISIGLHSVRYFNQVFWSCRA
jgi:hypothetical protein